MAIMRGTLYTVEGGQVPRAALLRSGGSSGRRFREALLWRAISIFLPPASVRTPERKTFSNGGGVVLELRR